MKAYNLPKAHLYINFNCLPVKSCLCIRCSHSCILINKIITTTHRGISVTITQLQAILRSLTVSALWTSLSWQFWHDFLPYTDIFIVTNTFLNFHISEDILPAEADDLNFRDYHSTNRIIFYDHNIREF